MVGIVIVTYNSQEVIGECLDACLRLGGVSVVVVDNHSQDATLDQVRRRPSVKLLANPTNRGFAGACNQGIALLKMRFILLLNPDTVVVSGLQDMVDAVGAAGVGAAGGRLINDDGTTQSGFHVRGFPTAWTLSFESLGLNRIWPGNPVNESYRPQITDLKQSDVDQPAGAFLMIRKAAWELIGGFDEQFHPIWFEDVDFCKRLHLEGLRIVYIPTAVARHQGGHSAARISWASRQLYWYGSLLRYAAKHFTVQSSRAVSLAVVIACVPRGIAGVLHQRNLKPVSVYGRVMWLAGKSLLAGQAKDLTAPKTGSASSTVSSQVVEKHVQQ